MMQPRHTGLAKFTAAMLLVLQAGLVLAQGQPAAGGSPGFLMHDVTDSLLPSGVYNVVTYEAPRAVRMADLGLKEAGLAAGPVFRLADEARIFESRSVMEQSPKARLWLNAREGGRWWYHTGGEGSAEGHVLQPGEVLVILTRASTRPLTWTNPLR